jgi:uncharacterized membrane protein YhhN
VAFESQTAVLCALCLLTATGYIVASWSESKLLAGSCKAFASLAFVFLALFNEASESTYGRYVLLALTLSLIGDLCLLSRKSHFLLAGIAAFFFAHVAYVGAFLQLEADAPYFMIALVCSSVAAIFILRWIWGFLEGPYRVAVPAYLVVMIVMASLAIAANSVPFLGIAAILFAVSDMSVARDRFVKRDIVNKAWGLPLYYIAQLLFAASVASIT